MSKHHNVQEKLPAFGMSMYGNRSEMQLVAGKTPKDENDAESKHRAHRRKRNGEQTRQEAFTYAPSKLSEYQQG